MGLNFFLQSDAGPRDADGSPCGKGRSVQEVQLFAGMVLRVCYGDATEVSVEKPHN